MAGRYLENSDPVTVFHDGDALVAARGESLAAALVANDRLVLGRSPKLHRPRGAACLRGECAGCLARVDGEPNVLLCRRRACGGEQIETQNVLGSRGVDLLRASDFLFPRGIDHHRLMAGVPGVSAIVQRFARQVAGLGRLPERSILPGAASRERRSLLIVGGGRSGLGFARLLASHDIALVDEGLHLGGKMVTLEPEQADRLVKEVRAAEVPVRQAHCALAVYREAHDAEFSVLVASREGVIWIQTPHLLLATGRHDEAYAFGNNDLPGIFSARAACSLWRGGIHLGTTIALVGRGPFATAFESYVGGQSKILRFERRQLVRAVGRRRLSGVMVTTDIGERRRHVDALVLEGPGAASLELAVQAGARLRFDPCQGYVALAGPLDPVAPGVWLAGSAAATRPDMETLAATISSRLRS